MPLTASTDYKNALTSTIKEEWIFELRNNTYTDGSVNTQYIRIGTALVGSGATQYHSLITSLPSIRESIDLVESTSKVGNISITCVNGQLSNHSNATLAAEIYGGTRKYINRDVVVKSRVGGQENTIYTGRLKSVRLENQDTVTIEISARTPIDFLKIPEHTSNAGNFFPIFYGSGTPQTSSVGTHTSDTKLMQYSPAKVFPVMVDSLSNGQYNCLAHEAVTDGRLHYPIKDLFSSDGFPVFVPLDDAQNNSFDDYEGATNDTDKNVLFTDLDLERAYLLRPVQNITITSPSAGVPTNTANFSDNDNTTSSTWNFTAPQGDGTDSLKFKISDISKEEHEIQECKLYVKWQVSNHSENSGGTIVSSLRVKPTYFGASNTVVIDNETGNRAAAYSSAIDLLSTSTFSNANGQIPDDVEIEFLITHNVQDNNDSAGSVTIDAFDFFLEITTKITDTDNLANSSAVTGIKKLYTGADGFDQSFNAGNVATNIVQMHRDLIHRFAGITDTPENYSALNTARSSWTVYYYLHKQEELQKVLDKTQKEGGFIFRFKASDGSPQYIYLVDSPSTNHTISKSDITNTNISLTAFDNLITKRVLKYQRNPINDELLFEKTFTDTTNDPRGIYNVQSEENVSSEDLEILSGAIGAANGNMGSGNKNDGYANYYNAIEGNPKILVETEIINPGSSGGSHFYLMEVGDICAFDHTDMIVEPFGESFNGKKFMVVGIIRNPGNLKVSLREI
mgnify:CR=1 FL=1|tara:strand:+ start:2554 stop:4764 length:2211 start_codon:yes stop_codon:yes gene_type:complete